MTCNCDNQIDPVVMFGLRNRPYRDYLQAIADWTLVQIEENLGDTFEGAPKLDTLRFEYSRHDDSWMTISFETRDDKRRIYYASYDLYIQRGPKLQETFEAIRPAIQHLL